MPYDIQKDQSASKPINSTTFGSVGRTIVPSDTVDLDPYAKAVVCLTGGNLTILPSQNADGAVISFTGVVAGYVPPFQVRRVLATGTTATVAAIDR